MRAILPIWSEATGRRLLRLLSLTFVVSTRLVSVTPAYAQSLGDLARQQREQRQNQPAKGTHVYDNCDLQKGEILVPEDKSRADAAKQKTEPPVSAPPAVAESADANANEMLPLGDIARRFRALKTRAQKPKSETRPAVSTEGSLPLDPVTIKRDPNHGRNVRRSIEIAAKSQRVRGRIYAAPSPTTAFHLSAAAPAMAYPALPRVAAKPFAGSKPVGSPARKELGIPIVVKEHAKPILADSEVEVGTVRVKTGDTLWKIAATHLGRGEKWRVLLESNPQLNKGTTLRVGQRVRLPSGHSSLPRVERSVGTAIVETTARLEPLTTTVKRGDSLWKLAQAQLGNGKDWPCLAQANSRLRDANVLLAGQLLTIPPSCSLGARGPQKQ